MKTLILATAAAFLFVGAAGAQQGTPTETEAQTDATTVPAEETAPMPGTRPAPRSGRNPIATTSEQNATTVQPDEELRTGADAPQSGVNPSATEQVQDATTVRQ